MTLLFYFLFILIVLAVEGRALLHPSETITDLKEIREFSLLSVGQRKDIPKPDMYYVHMMYSILALLGLFSNQWLLFLVILAQSFLFTNTRIKYKAVLFIDALLCLSIGLFIVINQYHLHIDLFQETLKLFS